MKVSVFYNLFEMCGVCDEDVIIYYIKHFSTNNFKPLIELCNNCDDSISLLIDAKFICEDEIKEDLINYYDSNFKNHPQKCLTLVENYYNLITKNENILK